MTVDRNLTTPYVWNWTLNLQQAITQNLSMEVAYVGNHGANLTGIRDINQPPVGSGWGTGPGGELTLCLRALLRTTTASSTTTEASRPMQPLLTQSSRIWPTSFRWANVYRSNYNGLQVTLNARNYHGLSMVAGYTYSHALDDVGANWDFGYGSGLPQNATTLGAEYANSDFDIAAPPDTLAHLRHSGTQRLRPDAGRLGDQFDHHARKPAVLGPDGRRNGRGWSWPLPVSPPANTPIRWSFYGKTSDFKVSRRSWYSVLLGSDKSRRAAAQALSVDGGAAGASTAS
jgi:hypothetical protein